MNCACGNLVDANSTCSSCGRNNHNCPSCGGGVSSTANTLLLACPYCDTPLHQLSTDEPPYFPVNFSSYDIGKLLNKFLLNRFGIPDDFSMNYSVSESALVFVPVRLFSVQAWLNETIYEVNSKAVMLTNKLWYQSKIENYRFAVRVKQVMQKEEISSTIYPIEVSYHKVEKQVQAFGKKLLKLDKKRFSKVHRNSKIEYQTNGEVFYPLYEMEYQYRKKKYRGVVDASNGVVLFSEHPMSLQSRAMVFGTGLMMIGVTLLLTFLFFLASGLDKMMILAPFVVFGIGIATSVRIFWTALRSHSGQEVMSVGTSALNLAEIDRHLPIPHRKQLIALEETKTVSEDAFETWMK